MTSERDDLVIDVVVENASDRDVGWDREFVAGLRIDLFIVRTGDWDEDGLDTEWLNPHQAEELHVIPRADRRNRERFVRLAPGEQMEKRLRLTDGYRAEVERIFRPDEQAPLVPANREAMVRFRGISKNAEAVDVQVEYYTDVPYFLGCFGVEPVDVKMWEGRSPVTERLRIRFDP